jgi:hypothetical protein
LGILSKAEIQLPNFDIKPNQSLCEYWIDKMMGRSAICSIQKLFELLSVEAVSKLQQAILLNMFANYITIVLNIEETWS